MCFQKEFWQIMIFEAKSYQTLDKRKQTFSNKTGCENFQNQVKKLIVKEFQTNFPFFSRFHLLTCLNQQNTLWNMFMSEFFISANNFFSIIKKQLFLSLKIFLDVNHRVKKRKSNTKLEETLKSNQIKMSLKRFHKKSFSHQRNRAVYMYPMYICWIVIMFGAMFLGFAHGFF